MLWGFISAYQFGHLHIWKGTINAEKYMQVLEKHMRPSRWDLFPYIFYLLQQCGFLVEESRCWTGLPAVQTSHQLKRFGTK